MTLFVEALACKEVKRPPVWLMRQAGRYLPSYQKLRARHGLHELFHTPELAAEITLLPLERFPLDAAILFSDLLLLAEVFGKKAVYPELGGACIEPSLQGNDGLPQVSEEEISDKLHYIFQAIDLVKRRLTTVPLLGFCPAPFTLLCYLVQGSIRTHMIAPHFTLLLDRVCEVSILYAKLQKQAGVDAVQVFDSWTHHLSAEEFALYALPYWKRFIEALPDCPLLFFSRTNSRYPEQIAAIKPTAISFDEGVSLAELRRRVPSNIAIQGNFSPERLACGSVEDIFVEASMMARSVAGERGVIFNLGHGILPTTPLENVDAFLQGLTSPAS
ncbi:MAG: uroporphyrinogen decarboxylase [Chlamydiae bacterium]|nr:uroporphyrinogen decarboxylase [Chlamydiota bacterium]